MLFHRLIIVIMLTGDIFSDRSSFLQFAVSMQHNMTGHDVLKSKDYEPYIARFNSEDNELYRQYISNNDSWNYLEKHIPLFDCPDKEFEMTYYFRWWVYRKHIKKVDAPYTTVSGLNSTIEYVITEFLPKVSSDISR